MSDTPQHPPQAPHVRMPPNPWLLFAEYGLRATLILDWKDHGILRRVWFNFEEIAPGVFRSNQPSHRRFAALKKRGITTVLNLRGSGPTIPHRTAKASCDALELDVVSMGFSARSAPDRATLLAIIDALKSTPRPFVMHCKSGADRTGFASALYLNIVMQEPMQSAMRMLAVKYVHLKWTKTGILDYILNSYIARNRRSEISFEEWAASEYDHQALQTAFNNGASITA
ncbi:tyrosine-protein phosphatase [Cognatishimia sp.]|uniref:tyrosine-protein phosphatase n=1 Tax=Cognatishimia sp. TaxID=2211648 RepID=UPI0035190CC0